MERVARDEMGLIHSDELCSKWSKLCQRAKFRRKTTLQNGFCGANARGFAWGVVALWACLVWCCCCSPMGNIARFGSGTAAISRCAVLFVLLLLLMVLQLWPVQTGRDEGQPDRHMATGAAQLVLGFALAQGLGGLWGEAAVVRYALVAVVIGFHHGLRLLGLSVLTLCCEGLFAMPQVSTPSSEILGSLLILGLFMGLREAVFRGELLRQQMEHKQRMQAALLDIERQAELFRLNLTEDSLVAATTEWTDHSGNESAADHRPQRSGNVTVAERRRDGAAKPRCAGWALRRALGLSTCAVLWESGDGVF